MHRKRLVGLVVAALVASMSVATAVALAAGSLTGAGSTLIQPLMAQWQAHSGISITYGAVGSGDGIADITARSVQFGASDAPLTSHAGTAVQRLHPDSVGADRDRDHVQHPRRPQPQADGPDHLGDLPGLDHQLGLPGHQEAQQARAPSEPDDHARVPQRRIGRHVCVHQLPLQGEQVVGAPDRVRRPR